MLGRTGRAGGPEGKPESSNNVAAFPNIGVGAVTGGLEHKFEKSSGSTASPNIASGTAAGDSVDDSAANAFASALRLRDGDDDGPLSTLSLLGSCVALSNEGFCSSLLVCTGRLGGLADKTGTCWSSSGACPNIARGASSLEAGRANCGAVATEAAIKHSDLANATSATRPFVKSSQSFANIARGIADGVT